MRVRYSILLLCCFLFVPSGWLLSQSTGENSGMAMNVFVTAGTVQTVDSATKKQLQKELKAKASQAKDQKKSLEKQLKAQLGGDKDKWPPEKREELHRAEDVEKMIRVQIESLDIVQKDLDDTAEDIKRSIQGEGFAKVKKYIRLVETREEADLTAEVICRIREGVPGLLACVDCDYYVYIKLYPEAGVNAANMSQVSPKGVRRIHQYREEEPYWIIEAWSQGKWGNAANQGAGSLNNFIEENQSVLKTKSTKM